MSNASMKRLSEKGRLHAASLYATNDYFFPLIACVLRGSQQGCAFGNDTDFPTEVYVEHAFGFSQIFGEHDPVFEKGLEKYLIEDKDFLLPKIRLYAPVPCAFMERDELKAVQSERQRFFLDTSLFETIRSACAEDKLQAVERVRADTVDAVEAAFGLTTRFWPTRGAFLENSLACFSRLEGHIASICYAAALDLGKAEIDVYTLEPFRRSSCSFVTAVAFIASCLDNGVTPLWDCFTNNIPSMKLREKLAFVRSRPPYRFFTIPK